MDQPLLKNSQTSESERYYASHHCNVQWRSFLASLATELFAYADPKDIRLFMRNTGAQMARLNPLPELETLNELQTAINFTWDKMDWGWVRLASIANHIAIIHGASPSFLQDDHDGNWERCMISVLEGCYSEWLLGLGSPAHLNVQFVGRPAADEFEFRYGR